LLKESPENRPLMAYVVVPHDEEVGYAGELIDRSTDLVVVYDSNLGFAGVITSSENSSASCRNRFVTPPSGNRQCNHEDRRDHMLAL
jgi:hypothetical protein